MNTLHGPHSTIHVLITANLDEIARFPKPTAARKLFHANLSLRARHLSSETANTHIHAWHTKCAGHDPARQMATQKCTYVQFIDAAFKPRSHSPRLTHSLIDIHVICTSLRRIIHPKFHVLSLFLRRSHVYITRRLEVDAFVLTITNDDHHIAPTELGNPKNGRLLALRHIEGQRHQK